MSLLYHVCETILLLSLGYIVIYLQWYKKVYIQYKWYFFIIYIFGFIVSLLDAFTTNSTFSRVTSGFLSGFFLFTFISYFVQFLKNRNVIQK